MTPDPRPGRVLFSTFGWSGPGGGTILPRQLAMALSERGWSVAALAAAGDDPALGPYGARRVREDGVDVTYIHNRPSAILDVGYPERDLRHEPVERICRELLERFAPDVVHWHNLHNLGASLATVARQQGIRNVLSTHNLWTACTRSHLEREDRSLCYGPADGGTAAAAAAPGPPPAAPSPRPSRTALTGTATATRPASTPQRRRAQPNRTAPRPPGTRPPDPRINHTLPPIHNLLSMGGLGA